MTILKRLWSLLSCIGPAPAGGAKSDGPKSLEPSDRTMFDDDEADAGGDEPQARADEPDEPEDPEEPDEPTEPAGEVEDTTADADDDDDDEADAGGDEDDEDDEDEDDAATALRASWEARLDTAAKHSAPTAPRLNLASASVREAAKKKFDAMRAEDADGKNDAEAIFEIAMDAALQVVGAYHDDVATPTGDRMEKSVRNIQVGRNLATFRKSVGEALTPKVEQKMADAYKAYAAKYGWRAADEVPLKDLFRMAGGRKTKAAKAPVEKPEDVARAQKREALGASSGPRALGRTRPEGGSGKPPKEDRALREFAQDARSRSPFFTLG